MCLYFGGFTGMYSETALNIALPQLSLAFGVELNIVQWLVVAYMLVIGLVLPFASLLMKWFTARQITLFALCSFLIGALISGFAGSFEICLVGRCIQGIGTGLVLPLMFAMVLEVIPPHKIGQAMGVAALVIMFAPAIGPTLAGFLIGTLSWRWIFFSFCITLAIAILFAIKFEVNPYELTKPRIDAISVITSCFGFGGTVLGAGMVSLFGFTSAPVLGSFAVGIVCLAAYIKRQLSIKVPVLDLHVFTYQGYRVGVMCLMLNFGITLAAMYVLPQFYQNAMLIAVAAAGVLMLPGGLINAAVSVAAGTLFDRFGTRGPVSIGFACSALASAMLMIATPETPIWYMVACHIIMMIGVPLAMSPCQALASTPPQLNSDGSTIMNTLQQVLGAICTAVATCLLAAGQNTYFAAGGTDSALAFTEGSHIGFAFTLIMAVFGFFLAFRINLQKEQSAQKENAEKEISGAPVLDNNGNLCGFVSDGDIIGTLAHQDTTFTSFYSYTIDSNEQGFEEKASALIGMKVGTIATKNVLTVDLQDDMRTVCATLAQHHLKKAPVMDKGKMIGIVSRTDITRYTVGLYAKAN
ncbi:MAG: hypothetical protein BHV62_02430 [Eggerthella sp. 51_9]|nr:MAG: hypothetical protein BHV62_02430 [Eggerthella sp. 51_9]